MSTENITLFNQKYNSALSIFSHLTCGILMAQLPAFIKVTSNLGATPARQPATGQLQDFFHHKQEYFVTCVWQKP